MPLRSSLRRLRTPHPALRTSICLHGHRPFHVTGFFPRAPSEPHDRRRDPQIDRPAHPHHETAQLLVRERREAPPPPPRRCRIAGEQHTAAPPTRASHTAAVVGTPASAPDAAPCGR